MPEAENKKDFTDLPTASIKGLEIFSSGKWNGDSYNDADLDVMVSAFNQVGFEPTVKAGHAGGQENEKKAREVFGAPALGYVEKIYRQGSKLFADLKDIPRKFADLIKAGAYKRISSEVYWNYSKGDQKFSRVLKAVAFLGADIPAITNLDAVQNLYKRNDTGSVYAYDENKNEFHVYEHEYDMMGMMGGRKLDKVTVNYAETGSTDGENCGDCRFYQGNQCSIVEGTVDYAGTCDMQKPYPNTATKMENKEETIISYEVDGRVVEAKNHFIQKKGSQFCVVSHSGKNLGCHPTREEAVTQLKAVEANKNMDANPTKQHSEKNSGGDDMPGMTEEEVNALLSAKLKEREDVIYKQFEDRIHKAREEGKEEATKEAELLREDIRKLQLEKRSERIEHWIKQMKDQGKILPSEESRVRSLRNWMPDEGPDLKYFAVKDGQTKEFTAGPAEMFEEFIKNRQSLLTNYSRNDDLSEEDSQEMQDPGAEVDRRAKIYMEKLAKEGKTISYSDGLKFILKNNAGLAQRYRDKARPN